MLARNCLFSALCLVTWALAGCAGSTHPTTIVCGTCEETSRFVRLQARPLPFSSQDQGGFSHPLILDSEDWETLLANIHVQPRLSVLRKGDEQPAFTTEEIHYLGMTLSRAFTQASPEQWVVFGLSNPVLSSGSEMTTGAWYVEGTTVHLLLPNFHAPVRMDNLREVLNRDPMFEVLNATRYELVPSPFSAKRSDDSSFLSLLRDETPHLAIEYQQLLAGEPSPKKTQEGEDGAAQAEKSDQWASSPSSLDERLATLKRLKEQDLITEEDYQRKKQALLDQL